MRAVDRRATGRQMNPALSHDARAGRRREAPDLAREIEPRDDSPALAQVQILPHEYVFGFFLLLTWVRLVSQAGPFSPPAPAFLGCLITPIGVMQWAARRPSPARWRVRLLL